MRHQVLIDSRDRDFETFPHPNTYRIRLPQRYTNVTGARVLSADIPLSFFVFKAEYGNTTLLVTVGDSAPSVVTIPDGNYDDQTMVEELRTSLAAAFSDKDFLIEVDPRTYQLVVTCVQGDSVSVDTRLADEPGPTDWGLAYYLGFPKGALTAGAPLRAPGMINLNPFTYILMDVQELGVIDEAGMYGNSVGRGCLCKIPIQGVSYEYIFRDIDRATDMVRTRALVPRLETLTVTFRLHDNRVVDFRGVEHSFLLEIETRDPGPRSSLPDVSPPEPDEQAPVAKSLHARPHRAELRPNKPLETPGPVPHSVYVALGATAAGALCWWWFRAT